MKGDLVIVRAFGGEPLVRRIWDSNDSAVFVTSDRHFEKLMAGEETPPSIGIPRDDVFQHDFALAGMLDELYEAGRWNWEELEQWRESN